MSAILDNFQLPKEAFCIRGDFAGAEPYGSGHINDTFAVTYNQAGTPVRYIFQRVNHTIFRKPEDLMENIQRVTDKTREILLSQDCADASRRALTVILSRDGKPYFRTEAGDYWRVYLFIEGAKTYDRIENIPQAYEVARMFGEFQVLVSGLEAPRLHETIPDFHNTRKRFDTLVQAIREDAKGRAQSVQEEINFILSREKIVDVLLNLQAAGEIPERITHNDTKLNNVMIDDTTGKGICVIDLDTVMPGLALYDFGDMVRTATSPALEDEIDLSKVTMQMPMFEALAKGYLAGMGSALTPAEKAHLAFSGKLITLEIGIRFLTDYLQGDQYFKIKRPEHNLDRCRTQLKLVQSIEEQEKEMEKLVESL
ncbi:MAG: aminoglycoside phosphotransferase family protein [Chthoniobacterales bacterium]